MKNKESILKRAKEFLEDSKEAHEENRERYENDIKFSRLGMQWPESIKRDREIESRPCLTFNKMPAFIRQVVNDSRQNKPSISVIPVGKDSDKDTADILEGIIRNIEVQSSADIAYDTAIENSVSGGFGYIRVSVDYAYDDTFDLDVCIDAVPNPLLVYPDPHSVKQDGSDWNKCLIEDWITRDEFEEKYPDADIVDFEDSESNAEWVLEDSVMIAEYWERKEVSVEIHKLSNGQVVDNEFMEENKEELEAYEITIQESTKTKRYKVKQYIVTADAVLEENDWSGKYIPIVPVYGDEVNENGKRHFLSLISQAKDAQRAYNYWRTSAVEKVALDTKAPWVGPTGAFDTDPNWLTANTQNHAYLEYDGGIPPQRPGPAGVPSADIQMALQAADDMKGIIGIYDAALGARSNETSGKAILARQRESDTGTFHFIDNMSRSIRHLGKIVVDLIPHVYNKERVVRILSEDGTPEEIQINQKFIADGIEKVYDLTVGKYDVVVKSGPSFTSRREESATQMMQMVQSFPQAAPLLGDLIAKNLDWPGADDIAERLKSMLPPQINAEIPPHIQQQLEQIQGMVQQGQEAMAELQQKNTELQAALKDKQGDLEIKRAELLIKEKELEIKQAEAKADLQIKAAEMQARAEQQYQPQYAEY